MGVEFTSFAYLIAFAAIVGAFIALRRRAKYGSIFREEIYHLSGDDLIGPDFRITDSELIHHERHIPKESIRGVYVQGHSSLRLKIGVVLHDDEHVHLSTVHNHDVLRAAVNAELLSETLAGQGEAFKQASNRNNWRETLMGAMFTFEFSNSE